MHRLLILLCIFCAPAHAALVEYDFTSVVDAPSPLANIGDEVIGHFWFDDAAPLIEFFEGTHASQANYDASGMSLWAQVGGTVCSFTGIELLIRNSHFSENAEVWALTFVGASGSASFRFQDTHPLDGALEDTALRAPVLADWQGRGIQTFFMEAGIASTLTSFEPTSVPEPGTLTLLSAGLLGLFGFSRRRRKSRS